MTAESLKAESTQNAGRRLPNTYRRPWPPNMYRKAAGTPDSYDYQPNG